MRILLFNHFPLMGSGSGVYTYEVAKCLRNKGHDIALVYPENAQDCAKPVASDGIWHVQIPFNCESNDITFNFPCFTSHPRSHNTYATLTDEEMTACHQWLEAYLTQAVLEFKPDLLHIQHIWLGAEIASRLGIPYVLTCHGTDLMGYRQDARYRTAATRGAEASSEIIAISEDIRLQILECFPQVSSKITLIYNGYNPTYFNLEPRALPVQVSDLMRQQASKFQSSIAKANPRHISFAGKLTHFKGVDVLLDAATLYERRLPDLHTFIAGDGELRQALVEKAKQLRLSRVHFIGHQSPETLAAIYQRSAAHIVPSRNEPFGLVAIEAMACGAPVIGTRAGGLAELISEEVGRLVPPEDPDALASAIVETVGLGRDGIAAKKSSRYAAARFGWERTTSELLQVYQQVLQRR